ncbi:hypothetical protein RND81_11G163400 [Saponaria officinalis]|uniref:Retrotransposon Copia-like N-terminal domain-containing protein n=1 Tax=Saponaria officinalis TaxID=3572 RepID=A0AAW1HMY1_SAPOF
MSETPYNSVYKDPLHLTSGDQSLLQIVPSVFNGTFFLRWSRSIRIALISKNKLGTDYTVLRWILNSLSDTIVESLTYVNSSKQLWDDLDERYNQSNAPYLYQLRKDVVQIIQGDTSVAEALDPLPECSYGNLAKCSCGILKKIVDRDNKNNLIDFLMGLDRKYEHLRGQILATDPLPTVNQAFAKVHQAKVQKNISYNDFHVDLDGVAMAASRFSDKPAAFSDSGRNTQSTDWRRDFKKPRVERPSFNCDFCHKSGHTKDFCWKLKGQKTKTPYSSGGQGFLVYGTEVCCKC